MGDYNNQNQSGNMIIVVGVIIVLFVVAIIFYLNSSNNSLGNLSPAPQTTDVTPKEIPGVYYTTE